MPKAISDGGIVKVEIRAKTIPQSTSLTAPFTQGSLFVLLISHRVRESEVEPEGRCGASGSARGALSLPRTRRDRRPRLSVLREQPCFFVL